MVHFLLLRASETGPSSKSKARGCGACTIEAAAREKAGRALPGNATALLCYISLSEIFQPYRPRKYGSPEGGRLTRALLKSHPSDCCAREIGGLATSQRSGGLKGREEEEGMDRQIAAAVTPRDSFADNKPVCCRRRRCSSLDFFITLSHPGSGGKERKNSTRAGAKSLSPLTKCNSNEPIRRSHINRRLLTARLLGRKSS